MGVDFSALDWGIVARAIHVAAVVVWIGGVWFVTAVLLPAVKQKPPAEWLKEFDAIEGRFAPQARIAVLLALLSGLYMLYRYDLWDRFASRGYWWMHLMVAVWLLFATMLFIVEPFIAPAVRKRLAARPEAALARMLRLHRIILALSLLAVLAAVAGSHSLF